MADSFIQYPADTGNTGKRLRTTTNDVGGFAVHSQYVYLCYGTTTATVSSAGALKVDNSGNTQPVSLATGTNTLTIGAGGTLAVTGPLTDVQLRATPVPVSGSFYPATQTISGSVSVGTVSIAGTLPVSGTFYQPTQPVNGTVSLAGTIPVSGTFYQPTQPISGTVSVGTVSISNTVAVAGTFYQATQPVSGPLTDTQLRASAVPVSGTFYQPTQPVSGTFWQATQPVSGTFWQATQPVSGPLTDTQLRASAVPVSGTFYPVTQPVSGTVSIAGTVPVSGTFFQGTQPVSGTFWQATQPVSGTFWQATQPVSLSGQSISIGDSTGKAVVGTTGTLTSTATTADQVIVTYTVTAGKTLYLQAFKAMVMLTTYAATATNFGTFSLQIGGTTKYTVLNAHAGIVNPQGESFGEPLPIAAGTVVRIVCTPAAATSFLWRGNLIGYEK
jgi:hypothetical protein